MCHESSGACGKVVKLHPLAGTVDLQTDQGTLFDVPAGELRRSPDAAKGPKRDSRPPIEGETRLD